MAEGEVVQTQTEPQSNPAQDRIRELSGKAAEAESAKAAALAEKEAAEKRAQFAEGFADVISQYPAAKEFKADIQGKVNSGYTIEDATLAVLGKAGKLGATAPIVPQDYTPAGGSSATVVPQTGVNKSISEMSLAEKREALSGISATELFSPFKI